MANSFLNSNGYNGQQNNGRFAGVLGPDGLPFRKDAPEAGFTVPHAIQFSSLQSSGFRSYYHTQYDEAVKHSREDALAMRNDAYLMALLQERKLATASLRWGIHVDDERDPLQKAVQDGITRIVRRIPRFRRFIMYMLEAVWYGRYASQIKWGWEKIKLPSLRNPKKDEERRCLVVKNHMPINGDKIGHHWDGTPYILINSAMTSQIKNAEISPTTSGGMGLYLRGSWRWHYCVHTHEAVDADFFDSSAGDAIHGVGIRSVLFWLDWLRKEWLSNVADWCERTGLGIRLWYYQGNNPNSKAAVEKAARESNDRTNLFIPRYQVGANASEGVEFVDTSSTGADLLLRLQTHIEEIQERYVIGQSMSGGQGQGDSLGGEGKSKLAKDTKDQIRNYDAGNLGETLTTDLVRLIQFWTFNEPEARAVNARFVFNVDEPDPEKLLNAVKTYVMDLGGKVRTAMVDSALGFDQPQEGDEVISIESIEKQKQAAQPQPQPGGMPGMPGQPGGQSPMPGKPPQGGGAMPGTNEPGPGGASDPLGAALGGLADQLGGAPGTEDVKSKTAAIGPVPGSDDAKAKVKVDDRLDYARDRTALLRSIVEAEADVDPSPSEAARDAGNYRKGHVTIQGLPITIENASGSTRSGIGAGGKPWSVVMANAYGYVKKTESDADGDHIDCFIGPHPESEIVFVVDQNKADGETFDECKVMVGWTNAGDAKDAYHENYSAGWRGFRQITPMTMDAFKAWIENGDTGRPMR